MKNILFLVTIFISTLFSQTNLAEHHNTGKAYNPTTKNGLVNVRSNHSVSATADKLQTILKTKGMNVFTRIDHAAGAKKADLELRPTELIVFGNPKVGTPLMQCAPSVAIDLPQKMLIWQDNAGVTWLTYNDPMYLMKRHKIKGCDTVLNKVSNALKNFSAAAAK